MIATSSTSGSDCVVVTEGVGEDEEGVEERVRSEFNGLDPADMMEYCVG
jgi:acetate kinase